VILQLALTTPAEVGANSTVSDTEELAGICVPTAKDVVGEKPLPRGGVELDIVSGRAPLFSTRKLDVVLRPTRTVPKSSGEDTRASCAEGSAEPERGTPKSPMLVSRVATDP
jgi:hypothetical protein